VPCHDRTTGREFFSWIRRQMTITRVYAPDLWWPAVVAHLIYCAGMAAAVLAIAHGSHWAIAALIALLGPGTWKRARRAATARMSLPEHAAWFHRYGWIYSWLSPIATWVWLIGLVSSVFGNTIHWRGYRYRLRRARLP